MIFSKTKIFSKIIFLDLLLEAAEGATDSAFLARVMSSLPSSLAAFMTTARSVSMDLILEGLGL